ncbi:tRNA (uracil-O(2)-)-methyltransferase [Cercospora zeina]
MVSPVQDTNKQNDDGASTPARPAFKPKDGTQIKQSISLPDELWHTVLECPCTFPTAVFNTVMLNLIKNPNITSSHLFRADIFYDSETDHSFNPDDTSDPYRDGLVGHMRKDLQPIRASWPDFRLERTIVRQLIPRNPQLDKPIVQTCHVFEQYRGEGEEAEQRQLVLYIPHVLKLEDMPFYHPTVSQLAFLHTWKSSSRSPPQAIKDASSPENSNGELSEPPGTLTLFYRLFPSETLTTKLSRTALKLLQTIHKHGQGQLAGYEKRVHHDQIIPQKRYQDTYTRLKAKHGRHLSEKWVEVTDPGKHVFEDIAIAAFLIELWRDMYAAPIFPSEGGVDGELRRVNGKSSERAKDEQQLPRFPGFVDIGCGNGILTYILLAEGYSGSGFDARQRKTWSIFPGDVQSQLEARILVPRVFQDVYSTDIAAETTSDESTDASPPKAWHSGIFACTSSSTDQNTKEGPFIISNHADELTAWTPLLAYLNTSSFIAIPCCSHDLSGARFRAPAATSLARSGKKEQKGKGKVDHPLAFHTTQQQQRLPQQQQQQQEQQESHNPEGDDDDEDDDAEAGAEQNSTFPSPNSSTSTSSPSQPPTIQIPESGSLRKSLIQQRLASAYSTLCSYVVSLATDEDLDFDKVETETLRIPSTRNTAIIGRQRQRRRRWRQRQNLGGEGEGGERQRENENERKDGEDVEVKLLRVREVVEREMKRDIETVAKEWIGRAEGLMKKPGSGH